MHSHAYEEYLHSDDWAKLRRVVLSFDRACLVCGATSHLDVHHLTYDRLGHERRSDLAVLCHDHHMQLHDLLHNRGRPVTRTYCNQALRLLRGHNRRSRRPWFLRFF